LEAGAVRADAPGSSRSQSIRTLPGYGRTIAVPEPASAPMLSAEDGSSQRSVVRPAGSERHRRDRELFLRLKEQDDRHAREELVERFMGLARQVAVRYRRQSEPLEDVMQVAALGLLKAIDRFDPDRGIAFSSFAVPTMLGEVKRHFRDKSWTVRPPRDLQELTLRVEQATSELASSLGRSPSVPELAEHLSVSDEDVLEALEAGRARSATSLSAPRGDEEDGATLGDLLGDHEDGFDRAEDRATLAILFNELTPRERTILTLRFRQDMTQAEIGEIVGVSQMQVSRIIRAAIDRLRMAAQRRA
jgi:RNA polymerase sigma-B factor